jgi:KaiC/GvpD/RAD55 family RecA-like ATPase
MQSLYEAALQGEKSLYICLEEEPEQLKRHMRENFNWKIDELEKNGLFGFMKLDAMQVAREVEGLILQQNTELESEIQTFAMPFKPDRIAFDSLSALSLAFGKTENYRQFIRYMFKNWKQTGAITFVMAETEQNPEVYSRSGVEEFLADGVIVLYNIKQHNGIRQQALEILKIRNSKHQKRIVPFEITQKGIEIYTDQEIFE